MKKVLESVWLMMCIFLKSDMGFVPGNDAGPDLNPISIALIFVLSFA